ncbi:MAG: T9SS type A sorting domain-containing protein [Crocinitomicaceae bacterium]|nr:T9SS type A sorting domain-containing protein [Crocinitomicaceae bacterium]MCF8410239.1 T9SS type A sorting domain-containing protein [Crocinitomicaceae bacterium]MCF8443568.1 T9SS type A sorting domain-containing protein [Crocinitomicaceae bacterium]
MKYSIFTFILVISTAFFAQKQGDGGLPKGLKRNELLKSIDKRHFSEPNITALRAEDALVDNTGTAPWRFGFNNYTQLDLQNAGSWIELPNGDKLWLLEINCENALTVNLTFANTEIPIGNELYVFNKEKDFILGKFTANHLYEGQLGTELIPGNTAIVEYFVKKGNELGNVDISIVTHGYRTATEFSQKAFGGSGSCNRNVNCPEGAAWTFERNSAVMLVSGSSGFCSGALINNTLNDGKPYVLTADHCYSNPATWIFRFNWQSPDCNNPATSPTFQSLSGAVLRSRATASDVCLVEITGGLQGNTVPINYNPYFSGWDNSGNTPTSGTGIHHPSGDIKKISFENNPLISTTFGSCPPNSHWGVTTWDSGVTEGGSSGSPLYDQNHRIIGQLHGGASACGASSLSDEYGKFSVSWEPAGSTSATQLKYWLDPTNLGAQFIDGYDPTNATPVAVDPGITNPSGVAGTYCGADITPSVTIQNNGSDALTTVDILYGFDGSQNQTYNWTGNLAQWQSTVVTLPIASLTSGAHTFSATVSNPNAGLVDENTNNNVVSASFNVVIGGQSVQLNLSLDCYGTETTWELQNSTGSAIYSGSGYSDNQPGLVTMDPWCLNYGCYTYVIMDSYGDGLFGGVFCAQDGSVSILYNTDTLANLPEANIDFGNQTSLQFCVSQAGIEFADWNDFTVFPNPFTEQIVVNTQGANEIILFDITGKIIQNKKINASSTLINFDQSLSSGAYFISVKFNDGHLITKKLVKQ